MKLRAYWSALIIFATLMWGCDNDERNDAGSYQSAPPAISIRPGLYELDPAHASILIGVGHQGFSQYTFRFDEFTVTLVINAERPLSSSVTANVDVASINTGDEEFDAEIAEYLGAPDASRAIFVSTEVEQIRVNAARVIGDLTIRGVKKPAQFDVTLNRADTDIFGQSRLGLSIEGAINRSDYGVAANLPFDDVSDETEIHIEIELTAVASK